MPVATANDKRQGSLVSAATEGLAGTRIGDRRTR